MYHPSEIVDRSGRVLHVYQAVGGHPDCVYFIKYVMLQCTKNTHAHTHAYTYTVLTAFSNAPGKRCLLQNIVLNIGGKVAASSLSYRKPGSILRDGCVCTCMTVCMQ